MIAGYENDKYIELLGCYAHSADFELALYSDKVLSVVDRVWENLVKGKEIIQYDWRNALLLQKKEQTIWII